MNYSKMTKDELIQELKNAKEKINELEKSTNIDSNLYEDLRISEERFRKSFHLSVDAVNINRLDDGVYLDINQGFTNITGYTRDEIIGKSSLEFNIWDNPDDRKRMVDGLKKEGKVTNLKALFRAKDGALIIGSMNASLVTFHGIPCVLSITRDITEYEKAVQSVIDSEAKYRSIVDNAIEAIVVIQDNTIKLFNPIASILTGYTDEEFWNLPIAHFIHPDDLPKVVDRYQRRVAGENIESIYQFRILKKNKDIVWVEVKVVLITWEGHHATLNFLNDITEKKKIQDSLIESENTYRTLVEGAGQPIFTVNEEGVFLFLNSVAAASMRGKPDELVGKTMWQLFPKEIADLQMRNILTAIKSSQPQIFQSLSVIQDEQRWYEARINPLVQNSHPLKAALCIVTDVTDRKLVENRIMASLKEKEVLLKEVHHRVKNNLQVVQSLLSLQESKCMDSNAMDAFKSLKNRIRSMALVHERLYKTNDFADVNFRQYSEAVVRELFYSYNTSDQIKLSYSIDEVHLSVDKAIPCGLILNELVSNSLKHAFPNGRSGEISIQFHLKDNAFELCIYDNGIGFEFHKENNNTLGFTLVQVLTQQIKGELFVDSDKGTKVTVRFK